MIPQTPIYKLDDLHPDGVRISVDWSNMPVGASIFVPCVNTTEAIAQTKKLFKEFGWSMDSRIRVESGKLGVRIWRTL